MLPDMMVPHHDFLVAHLPHCLLPTPLFFPEFEVFARREQLLLRVIVAVVEVFGSDV